MGKRIIVILASLALLYSFGMHEALSQANGSRPPGVPEFIGGEATIEGQSAQGGEVYLRIDSLCIIFLDGLNDQSDITAITNGLNADDTMPLALAFLNSDFCQNYGPPPLELLGPTTVNPRSATEWDVMDPSGTFYVFTEDIQIWQGTGWGPGKKLQVNMHNCKIASSPVGSAYSLVLGVNDLPEDIWWGNNTYTLTDPGSANVGDEGYFYIKYNGIERRVTKINDQEIPGGTPHYVVGQVPFSLLNLDAPELIPLDIELYEGFNLFSIPFNLPNTTLSVVLADIFYSVESVFVLRGGIWYGAAPDHQAGTWDDEIGTIDGGETFVIYMLSNDTLSVAGTPLVQRTVILNQDFNLAPYNCARVKTVEEAFGGIRDYVQSIFVYDAVNHLWLGCAPDPAGGWDTEFATLSPGVGIVIYCLADSIPWDVGP